MHIPDGFLSSPVAVGYGVASLAAVGIACRVQRKQGVQSRALLGVSAAFIFAAQLVNFPVAAGTSGHLIGATLAAALLGLPGAIIVLSCVLLVQCLVFGDGGLLALGANVFNMAVVCSAVGFFGYRLLCGARPSATRRVASVAFAGFSATLAAAASCAGQLALSGTARLGVVLPAMLGTHALIGVGEAVLTALVVSTILRFRADLLDLAPRARPRLAPVGYGLGLVISVLVLLVPIASSSPDGLEQVLARLGLVAHGAPETNAPVANYALPGLPGGALGTVLAGALGVVLLYGACWLLAFALVPRAARPERAAHVIEPSG